MNEQPRGQAPVAESWSTYWSGAQGVQGTQAWSSGGSGHPALAAFWRELFAFTRDLNPAPRLLDIASGSGAVAEAATEAHDEGRPAMVCVDISAAAIRLLGRRYPEATCLVADARSLPVADASFDVVTSQFGIEYAGADALDEALRVVAPRGVLALVVHCRDGLIHRRCRASRDAVVALQDAEFLPRCRTMFETGFAALSGSGSRDAYGEAGRALAPAIRAVEGILARWGQDVADETIARIYRDVRDIHGRLGRFDAAEVLAWLERMEVEIVAYHGRMASMCDAAIDGPGFDRWTARTGEAGFDLLRSEPLAVEGSARPLAWVLVARRR